MTVSLGAVVADRIDIPPGIAARRDPLVGSEVRDQARRRHPPDSATIGTPARMDAAARQVEPGIFVRAPGRRNDAAQPCVAGP
jgi:hypothetical protein